MIADFNDGQISSDAGAGFIREAERHLNLVERLAACIADPRRPELIERDMATMVGQPVYGCALGYEDLNDHQWLGDDQVIHLLTGAAKTAASPPTACRMENTIDKKLLGSIASVLFEALFESSGDRVPKELIPDFDPAEDPIHYPRCPGLSWRFHRFEGPPGGPQAGDSLTVKDRDL